MKLTIKGIEIECTVDEFEELFVRGLLDKDIKPEDFNELPKVQPFTPQTDNDKYVPRKPFLGKARICSFEITIPTRPFLKRLNH